MYDGLPVIDCHGHMSSPPEFRAYMANLVSLRGATGDLLIEDDRWHAPIQRHLDAMDERRIDVQLLSPRPVAMMHWERPYLVRVWTDTTNRVIRYICERHPQRFVGIAQLPQTPFESTERCADVLEECVRAGFVGGLVNPDPGADRSTPGMNDPYWFPLYERSEALRAPLIVHPAITRDPRVDLIPHSYQYNNVTEETLAMLLLQHSDVFERFPDLRIVVCHCGGALSRFIENGEPSGQRGGGSAQPLAPGGEVEPPLRDVSSNLFVDSCVYAPYLLIAGIKQYGVDRICFGTEVPGSGTAVLNPITRRPSDDLVPVIESFEFLSDADRRKLFNENAIRVFPLLESSPALRSA